ncbi:MAG: CmcI family methyltransferase [Bdellovibrionota bacterium]
MYSRSEFEEFLKQERQKMSEDKALANDAKTLIFNADKYHWIHQTKFLGEPCLQLPQDLFAIQEIIFKVKPDYIVEAGVAWGGSLLFYASVLEALGQGKVIGIDKYIPEDLKERLSSKGSLSKRIELYEMDSCEQDTRIFIHNKIPIDSRTILILDANHTKNSVLKELDLYSDLVTKDSYIICCSTVIEYKEEKNVNRSRPWGKNNNPLSALREFLNKNDRFLIDNYFDQKLLLSCNPHGYLRCIK